jgi:hypothetical protein
VQFPKKQDGNGSGETGRAFHSSTATQPVRARKKVIGKTMLQSCKEALV